MKRIAFIAAAIILAVQAGNAQGRGFGIGLIMGEPAGITAKGWISSRAAIDAGLAWSMRGDGYVHAHMDYLWHFHDIDNTDQEVIPYLGVGGRIAGYKGPAILGVRVVGGVAWWPEETPIDLFLEIAPVVDLAPETQINANAGIGIRFFFR